jgi:DNA-damage-inducible protein D
MKTKKSQKQNVTVFENLRKTDTSGNEYWSARELAKELGYDDYNLFFLAVQKAMTACGNAGQNIETHFKQAAFSGSASPKGHSGSGDVKLSRYGCYLTIQNGDPDLKPVALAQAYFAVQARLGELSGLQKQNNLKIVKQRRYFLRGELAKRNVQLAGAARKAGIIKPEDFAFFQNHGYRGLYGGLDVKALRELRHLDADQNVLDHMDSSELAANLFRVTQTAEKLNSDQVHSIVDANSIHFAVGLKVRNAMEDTGIALPETLPVVEDIMEQTDKEQTSVKKVKKEGRSGKK